MVDLIRTVSRDISPDPSSKDCDCYIDFYQEKENQTDDQLCQSIDSMHEYARKIEAQQAEIEMLNTELDKKVCIIVRVCVQVCVENNRLKLNNDDDDAVLRIAQ